LKDQSYTIKLDSYEGPLELLLVLIKRNEIDIFNIPLVLLINQYLEHLEIVQKLKLPLASEFISMAAQLIYFKSRALLPDTLDKSTELECAEPSESDFIRQLIEYKKFKDASELLYEQLSHQEQLYSSSVALPEREPPKVCVSTPSVHELAVVLGEILRGLPQKEEASMQISPEKYSITQTMLELEDMLKAIPVISFVQLFEKDTSQEKVIHTFLSLLELIRANKVYCKQDKFCGEVWVSLSCFSSNEP